MRVLIKNRQRYLPLTKPRIEKAARNILTLCLQDSIDEAELSILFVGERKVKELNTIYRGKTTSTDVLSL